MSCEPYIVLVPRPRRWQTWGHLKRGNFPIDSGVELASTCWAFPILAEAFELAQGWLQRCHTLLDPLMLN